MSDNERWCGNNAVHDQHWLRQGLLCRGVLTDEAAAMSVTFDSGYAQEISLDRDDAALIIEAIDRARGDA